jgi:Nucleotidyltransferase domain
MTDAGDCQADGSTSGHGYKERFYSRCCRSYATEARMLWLLVEQCLRLEGGERYTFFAYWANAGAAYLWVGTSGVCGGYERRRGGCDWPIRWAMVYYRYDRTEANREVQMTPAALPTTWPVTQYIDLLRQHRRALVTRYQIEMLGLFGSYIRNEQHSSSDLDLLVTPRYPS